MLVESSLCSSIETSPFNVYRCQSPFAGHCWLSHGEAFQMFHKFPENPQGSFPDAVPATGGKDLDVSSHPNHQTFFPEQSITYKAFGNAPTSRVYRRRKQIVNPSGTSTEDNPMKSKGRGDEPNDSRVSENDREVNKRRDDWLNNCIVYSRRKWRLKSPEHDSGETKRSGDQLGDSLVSVQKKQQGVTKNGTATEHCPGKIKRSCDWPDGFLVYSRKKRREKRSGTLAEHNSGETKKSSDRLSVVGSLAIRHSRGCDRDTHVSSLEHIHKSPVAVARVSDGMVKSSVDRTREVDSKSDGFSTSKSISGPAFVSTKSGAGEATRCSSGAMVAENMIKDISAEDLCVSVLRGDRLLDGAWSARTSSHVEEETCINGASSSTRQCKTCNQSGPVEKMLICDKCEEAFHTYCCSIQMKEIPEIDEWLCTSCLKKKQKIIKRTNTKKRGRAARERKWRPPSPKNGVSLSPVALMLRDAERHKTGVQIGKDFQAEVPDWSGPTTSDTSLICEPLDISQSDYTHHSNITSSIGNWLQCREEDINGEICGKWRRAPISEVQTDDWECYCCVFWDPPRADCAVPQELETSEILKQLKYIETLRPQLDARRRKLEGSKRRGGPQGDATSR